MNILKYRFTFFEYRFIMISDSRILILLLHYRNGGKKHEQQTKNSGTGKKTGNC